MNEIFQRFSVRDFTDQPVSQEDIEKILHAAMQAPSAVNQQPWEFYVITNKEVLDELANITPYSKPMGKAPLGIVMVTRKETIAKDYQLIDMGICSENIMLECVSLGLGSVIMGVAPDKERIEKVDKILNLGEGLEAFAMLAIGYPTEAAKRRTIQNRFDENRIHYVK